MFKITLENDYKNVSVEIDDADADIDTVFQDLVYPSLLAIGYAEGSVIRGMEEFSL